MVGPRRPFVASIYLHPVKSCRRVEVDHAAVSRYGLVGDRERQVQGPAGQLMTQRKFPALARVQPEPIPGGLRLMCDGMPDLEVQRPARVDTEGNTMTGRVRWPTPATRRRPGSSGCCRSGAASPRSAPGTSGAR